MIDRSKAELRGVDQEGSTARTESPASAELETLLRRYGASGFTVSTNYKDGNVVIAFTMPRHVEQPDADPIEVRMAVGFRDTLRRLEKMPEFRAKARRFTDPWGLQQAERVAWRQVILWCEAGLNAAASGIQTLEEAFFAHSVIPGTNTRVIDAVHMSKLLTAGKRDESAQ